MLDGHSNRLVYTEAVPMSSDPSQNPGGLENPHGNGYYVKESLVSHSGGYDSAPQNTRTFKIQNTSSRNPVNGQPVAYKIMAAPFQPILSAVGSFNWKRAEFADKAIYAVAYKDDELYSGGKYTNQSRGGTGVRSWADRKDDITDKDLVVFVQFGLNHVTRTEDFPVMPCETQRVMLKPVNFFDRNPAIDVPQSQQGSNKSVLLSNGNGDAAGHRQGNVEARIDGGGEVAEVGSCCDAGSDGVNGANATNGTNGMYAHGTAGTNGTNGTNDTNGTNGTH